MGELNLRHFRAVLQAPLRRHVRGFALAAGAMLGFSAAELLAPWPIKLLVDNVLLERPWPPPLAWLPGWSGSVETSVAALAGLAFGIAMLKGALSYLQVFVTSKIGFQMVHELRSTLFGHLQRLSLTFHQRSRTGELLHKVTADTGVLKDALSGALLEAGGYLLTICGMCVVLAVVNIRLASILAVTLPVLAFTVFTIYRRGKASARRQRESEGHVAARIAEMLHVNTLVRAFAREREEGEKFTAESARTLDQSVLTARTEAASSRAMEIVNAAGVSGALLLGGLMAAHKQITPGDLLIFLSYLSNLYKPLRNLAKLSTQLAKARISAERIEQILRMEPDSGYDGGRPVSSLRGDMEFRSVTFAYESGAVPVLQNLSFSIRAGERIALVGSSGAGKSTLAALLLRMQAPQNGDILVDGQPIVEFDSASYRRQFGVVLQDSLLLGSTIAENIAYGAPGANPAQIEQAARAAAAHDFIQALPDGYDTTIGERGSTLSGGQRQRLCLARALLTNPSILLLDEPTSAVDAESSALIHAAIARSRRTTIVIAHHFHDMRAFDRILVLDRGAIVESGTHAELLQQRGLYSILLNAQTVQEVPS